MFSIVFTWTALTWLGKYAAIVALDEHKTATESFETLTLTLETPRENPRSGRGERFPSISIEEMVTSDSISDPKREQGGREKRSESETSDSPEDLSPSLSFLSPFDILPYALLSPLSSPRTLFIFCFLFFPSF